MMAPLLSQWFADPADPAPLLVGSHDPKLVLLSLAVAVFASWMALQMLGAARQTAGRGLRLAVLGTASLALGGGIWAMHFIGMLAFDLCTQVDYDPTLTVLSLLPGIAASAVALSFIGARRSRPLQLPLAGLLVGGGIGAMHYSGMAAMLMLPTLRYDPAMFALSIVVAVVLAMLALWIRFGLGHWAPRLGDKGRLALSALVMGGAITGMHYTGMAAARFSGVLAPDAAPATGSGFLALAVALITVAFVAIAAAANALLRYRALVHELSASEARARALLATAVDGVLTLNQRGQVLACNASAESIFGRPAADIVGQGLSLLIPEAQDLAQHSGRSVEVAGRHSSGRPLALRLAIGETRLQQETLFIAFVSDVSERKAMESALRDSEQQFRSLIGNIPGISYRCLLQENMPMVFISDAVEQITGYPAADFLSPHPLRSFNTLLHPDDYDATVAAVRAALAADRPYLLEYRLIHRDGRIRWMWGHGGAVRDADGVPRWFDGVVLDISERKHAELEVQKFRAIVASSDEAIISKTLDGVINSWNQGAERVFGYAAAEVMGQPMSHFMPADRLAEEAALLARIASGASVNSFETVRLHKDGSAISVQVTHSPIHDEQGRVIGASTIARDVTERQRMDAALRLAKARAEQAAAARAAFMANMSHEIRTPMNAILGFTDVLLDSPLNTAQRRHLETVRSSARSLLRLLNEILDTAKLERGAVELEASDFNLLSLIDELFSTLGAQARAKGLALNILYAEGLPTRFHADELRVRQVLTNLLGNAIKFTEAGSVTLEVDGYGEQGEQIHCKISDTGIGIQPERLDAIFEPFTQADASMTRRFGGTGLGTSIAKQLVELMGGRIWVGSTPGQGSCFEFVLPLPPALASALAPAESVERLAMPSMNVLVVDDVAQNRELLELLLGQRGHRVTAVDGGLAAVARAGDQRFDLILMDLMMPDIDGLEATRRIRAAEHQSGRARTPIIALTASVMSTDRLAARQAGMDGFASKPVDLPLLLKEIAKVLGLGAEHIETVEPAGPAPDAAAVFDQAGALRRWAGEPRALQRALQRFAQDQSGCALRLQQLHQDGPWPALRAEAHKLRGMSANLGLNALSAALAATEQITADTPLPDLTAALADALRAIADAGPASDRPTPPPAGAADPDAAQAAKAALLAALDHGTLDDDALARLLQALPAQSAGLQALQRALADFDFDAARRLLHQLPLE